MSLADELGKLYELHKMDILSAEEFKSAKEAAIRRFSSGGAEAATPPTSAGTTSSASLVAAPPPPPQQQEQHPTERTNEEKEEEPSWESCTDAVVARFPLLADVVKAEVDDVERLFPLVETAALLRYTSCAVHHASATVLAALDHLSRICGNIIRHPENTKYHQLRLSNPRLAAELLSVPGTVPLLQSVGFDLTEDNDAGQQQRERWLRWRAGEERSLLPRLEQATTALSFLREREEGVAKHRLDLQRLYRSLSERRDRNVALDIRLEQARAAHARGALAKHVVQLYKKDDAGDGLYSASKHAHVVSQVLHTALELCRAAVHNEAGPEQLQSRLQLPLDSPAVFSAVVQQKGGLELLLVAAEATLQPLAEDGGHPAVALPSTGSLGETPIVMAFPSSPPVAANVERLAVAAAVASDVAAAVQLARQLQDNEARQAAEAAIKADRRRERLRQVHTADMADARQQEGLIARAGRRHRSDASGPRAAEATDGSPASSASSSSSLAPGRDSGAHKDESSAAGGGRKRVPIAEALAILMGKRRDDDGW